MLIFLEEKLYGKIVVEEIIEECKINFLSFELVLFYVLVKFGCWMMDVEVIGDDYVFVICDNYNKIYFFFII